MTEEWYTLEDIRPSDNTDTLYCISVNSEDRQFLVGNIGVSTHNSEQGKAEDELKGEASMIIGSIARLGRAAGVHLVIATQRPDASILPGETKANLGVRINCGRTNSTASSMILESSEGVRVKSNPRGRLYLSIYQNGDHGQGFFADPDWIDEYLASKGLNPDGTPITAPRSKLANLTDLSQFEGSTLDAREGVDNSAVIEKIRQEEEAGIFEDDDDAELDALLSSLDDEDEEAPRGVNLRKDPIDEEEDWELEDLLEEDEEEVQPSSTPQSPTDAKLGRPEFGEKKDSGNPWDRPEDTWDADLEALIEENNS